MREGVTGIWHASEEARFGVETGLEEVGVGIAVHDEARI